MEAIRYTCWGLSDGHTRAVASAKLLLCLSGSVRNSAACSKNRKNSKNSVACSKNSKNSAASLQ